MAAGISTYLANGLLNTLSGGGAGVSFTAPGTVYAQLHTASPGAAGTTAISVGSTARVSVTTGAAASGAIALSNSPSWTNGGTSETLTYVTTWDASTAGNFLNSYLLTASQAWASTNTFTLTSLGTSLTPLAA